VGQTQFNYAGAFYEYHCPLCSSLHALLSCYFYCERACTCLGDTAHAGCVATIPGSQGPRCCPTADAAGTAPLGRATCSLSTTGSTAPTCRWMSAPIETESVAVAEWTIHGQYLHLVYFQHSQHNYNISFQY
jgi:hypothetical protein